MTSIAYLSHGLMTFWFTNCFTGGGGGGHGPDNSLTYEGELKNANGKVAAPNRVINSI